MSESTPKLGFWARLKKKLKRKKAPKPEVPEDEEIGEEE